MSKLKWGIIGTGMIAKNYARSMGASETGQLFAVGSRSQGGADAFGDMFNISHRYSSYDALLADKEVDAVYIALPNHLHLEWAVKAAKAGKHILCEKPLTVNASEAEEMIGKIKKAGVFMMEAFMYRCHPQTAKLIQLIRDGAIGDVRIIQASFCYNLGDDENAYSNIRLRKDVCGGSIMDVGCYTISMARLIAGAALGALKPAEPESLCGVAYIGRGGVDDWSGAVARFPNGIVANLLCGARISVQTKVHIWGSKGDIEVPVPWNPRRGKIILKQSGKEADEIDVPADAESSYTLEADVVAKHISDRQAPYPCMTWEDSINNMKAMDQWRKSIGLVFDKE